MSFGGDIKKFAEKTGITMDNAVTAICLDAVTSVIKRTPVDTGRARGNWYASINDVVHDTSESRTASEALADGSAKAMKSSGKVFNLTNNLPYIGKLENGYSKQAPQGMVKVTALEINNALKRFAK